MGLRCLLGSLCVVLSALAAPADEKDSASDSATITYIVDSVAGTGSRELGAFRGSASDVNIGQPFGVEVGPDGALYICEVENHRVLRLDREKKTVATVAGSGARGYSGDGGPALEAKLNEPYEVRFDRQGNIYFVEMRNAVIRRVDGKTRVISTVAGTGEPGFSGDGGPATKARLRRPHSIALDGRGGLYIADIGNHRIRRVNLESGRIETVAGNGERLAPADGKVATGRPMLGPRALFIVGDTMWIALREGHSVWRMDLGSRRLTHVAGSGRKGYRDGKGRDASFNGPKGIVALGERAVFVVDTENQAIRRVDPRSGEVTTVAGGGPRTRGFGGDGKAALRSSMDRPHGIAIDSRGVLYIGDTDNHRVRRLRRRD